MALVLVVCLSAAFTFTTDAARAGTGVGNFRDKTVEITELGVPAATRVGQDVTLTCRFRLGGPNHRLYTVNWWRDKDQFYTYKGHTADTKHAYSFDGINVKVDKSSAETVMLGGVSEKTAGVFKCEVMGEAPAFRTAAQAKFMDIVVPPREVVINAKGPARQPKFRRGESVMLNCTARGAKPRAQLKWFLNGDPVRTSQVYAWEDSRDASGHITSTVGLRWMAPDHFYSGVARVTCMAAVGSFTKNETQVIYLHQDPKPLYNYRYYSSDSQTQVAGSFLYLVTLLGVKFAAT